MEKRYYIILGFLAFMSCKKEVVIPTVNVSVKVLNYDTALPIKDVNVKFMSAENVPSPTQIFEATATTDAEGKVSLALEDKPNFNYRLIAGDNEYVQIINGDFVSDANYRDVQDRFSGVRTLSHQYNFLEGGRFLLNCEHTAISNHDVLSFEVFQWRKGVKYTNTLAKINLSIFESNPKNAQFFSAYIANAPILVNYKYESKGVWKTDTLQFEKGGGTPHLLKY
jgi:5-hydroxyisourate hydrolase-like protein (transthyretin family)